MKRSALLFVVLSALAATGYLMFPGESVHYLGEGEQLALGGWDSVQANPFPVAVALGTFLLTFAYHVVKRKPPRPRSDQPSPRAAVYVSEAAGGENAVLRRARARATRTQLLTDQVTLENRLRKLPEEINKAEKESCYTEQALADARRKLAEKEKAHEAAVVRLEALCKEKAGGRAELAEMEAELRKLADVV